MHTEDSPAFPVFAPEAGPGVEVFNEGMTLRDYFAGQALSGIISLQDCTCTPAEYALEAYIQAEAMIEARKGWACPSRK